MYPKYKCFGCGNVWHSGEILVICPICRGKGVKIREDVSEKEKWDKAVKQAERFVGKNK